MSDDPPLPRPEIFVEQIQVLRRLGVSKRAIEIAEAAMRLAVADRDTRIEILERDNGRLAGLLVTTRDADVVEVTADRDSWMEQARVAQEQAAQLVVEVERLRALVGPIDDYEERRAFIRSAFHGGLQRAIEIVKEKFSAPGVTVVGIVDAIESASNEAVPPLTP